MAVERRAGLRRRAVLGAGAVLRLGDALGGAIRPALLATRSFPDEDVHLLTTTASRPFSAVLRVQGPLDRDRLDALEARLGSLRPDALVAVGGGSTMDAAKAVGRSRPEPLVLLPTTLSGSEHTANTSWYEGGRKVVVRAGLADAVLADPGLLVRSLAVLGPGALHAIAHTLATLAQAPELTGAAPRSIARFALRDLVDALVGEDIELPGLVLFQRGAWNAAVGFGLTGPRIGAHHLLVHALAPRDSHARFSSLLLCAALLQTGVYSDALSGLPRGVAERLLEVAARWEPRVREVGPAEGVVQALANVPAVERTKAEAMLDAVGAP